MEPTIPNPSHPLLSDEVKTSLEAAAGLHFGRDWHVSSFQDFNEQASHPSAILSDGERAVFAKLVRSANAQDLLEAEAAGLRVLREQAGILTPELVGILPVPEGCVLVLEALRAVERGAEEWRSIGRALARIHAVKGEQFGLERQNYFGPLHQDNRPLTGWREFFLERRLWPRFVGAIDSGHLPTPVIRQVERLMARLPGLEIPEMSPSLLHGDAQQNNFISTAAGAAAVDPSVFYGNPEIDLAHVDYFQAVPQDLFDGYRELAGIEPGFETRRELWRIPTHLAIVSVGALEYLPLLEESLKRYV